MRRRTRKFIGAGVMLAFVAIYAVVAMLVAQSEPVHRAPGWAQGIFYAIVGLAWILPLMPLIRWMERPDPDEVVSAL
ncbi:MULTISPECIES: DUF2842 domain-containing protein [Lichenihabitans]|uniref:DUF2842 domain-containing protein n=1 Tax=Lichenihabitans TaxID=2723776 RepID=UPI001036C5B1|nr:MULTISPECIES: DUF2842 domain-containing protein [Lichenihabitans]UDL95416.1 DUF2842 domain-containing protein [Lichenihabitans sp. PAMC28606]